MTKTANRCKGTASVTHTAPALVNDCVNLSIEFYRITVPFSGVPRFRGNSYLTLILRTKSSVLLNKRALNEGVLSLYSIMLDQLEVWPRANSLANYFERFGLRDLGNLEYFKRAMGRRVYRFVRQEPTL
jgi:hypothetical protein